MHKDIRMIFMGTPEFALPSLKKLIKTGYNIVAVVTQPDRPKGRGRKIKPAPVKELALKYGLEVLQPEKIRDSEFLEKIREKRPDFIVVVAYGQILPKGLLEIPKFLSINLHPSLLPKYRGAAPIQWAIMNDEKITGVTVIRMTEKMDAGPILLQKEVPILPDETAGSLHDRLSEIGADLLIDAIEAVVDGKIEEREQDESKATFAPKMDRSLSKIDWEKSAKEISARIRALDPWPGAVSYIKDKEIKLFSSSCIDNEYKGVPGRVNFIDEEGVLVETVKGIVLIKEFQIPGKRRLKAKEFLKGFSIKKGDRFF